MKKLWLLLVGLAFRVGAVAQALTVYPTFPTADGEITLIFDLTKARDGRAAGLLGRTSDLYLWAWGGSNPADRSRPEYTLDGVTTFSQAYAPARMTPLGNDRWSIRLTPRKFLNLSADKSLRWMGALVKNGPGTAQTEDFTFSLFSSTLNVAFFTPTTRTPVVQAGGSLPVQVQASARATLTLTLDGQSIASATDTLLQTSVPVGAASVRPKRLKISAKNGDETATDSLLLTVLPVPETAPLPPGLRDGINYDASGTVATLVLFAPGKQTAYVLGEFNNWETQPGFLMKKTGDGQRFWLRLDGLTPGQEVAFQYLVDGQIPVGDPYAEKILDRQFDAAIPTATYPNPRPFPSAARGNIVSVLQPGKTPYAWQTTGFQRPPQDNLVIYELLVRDFTAAGNYYALTDTIPYLKRLGVNAVELMPVNEFTANDSWGYNPIYYFAPDKAYGTEQALKKFIDECHRAGLAVILDVVFNHADYEFPYVKLYWDGQQPSADSPMFNQRATHPFSVFYDVNHDSELARSYFARVLEHWLTAYRVDGFRFDLSKGFTQKVTNDDSQFRLYDAGRIANLKRFSDKIRAVDPTAYVILEHFAEDREEQELTAYGMLVWGNLNGDFRGLVKGTGGNLSRLSYQARGFTKPALIGYAESHDEERVLFDAQQNGVITGSYSAKNLTNALERAKAAAALLLLTPGPKMIWQFGELGYDVSIDQNGRTGRKPQKWEYLRDADRLKLFKVYAALNTLKRTQPAFRSQDFALGTVGSAGPIQQLLLTSYPAQLPAVQTIKVLANLTTQPQPVYNPFTQGASGLPTPARWYDFFTGEEIVTANLAALTEITFQPGEFHVYTSEKFPTPEAGLVPWKNTLTITATEPAPASGWLTVYPNPTQETLILELESAYRGEVTLQISDATGRRITHFQPRKDGEKLVQHLPIRDLPGGLYLLQIAEGDRRRVEKFVKE
jgi:1,4-alpha-glucan branching enzyme